MLRFLLLPVILLVLLGMVHVLPERGQVAESAIDIKLPLEIGDWRGVKIPESQLERDILAKDTVFAKVDYRRPRAGARSRGDGGDDFDRVSVSVVLSGYDINNSIHRPERCLPAQGHAIYSKSHRAIDLPDGRSVPVCQLDTKQHVRLRDGSDQAIAVDSLVNYFFVGHDRLTNDHYERTFIDMKDRLLHGRDQRWAYVTVATLQGDLPWAGRTIPREEAEAMLDGFCAEFADRVVDWQRVEGGE